MQAAYPGSLSAIAISARSRSCSVSNPRSSPSVGLTSSTRPTGDSTSFHWMARMVSSGAQVVGGNGLTGRSRRQGGLDLGACHHTGRVAGFEHREALVGMVPQQASLRFRRGALLQADGVEVRDGGNRPLLPASQVARRTHLLDSVPILLEDGVVEVLLLQQAGDALTHQRAEHQGRHEGVFVRHLENNQDAGNRRSHDRAHAGAHPHDAQHDPVRRAEPRLPSGTRRPTSHRPLMAPKKSVGVKMPPHPPNP